MISATLREVFCINGIIEKFVNLISVKDFFFHVSYFSWCECKLLFIVKYLQIIAVDTFKLK